MAINPNVRALSESVRQGIHGTPHSTSFLPDLRSAIRDLEKPVRGIECFARDGGWFTRDVAELTETFTCCEIDPQFEETLRSNIPGATVVIGDVWKFLANSSAGTFDLVSIDNPQGMFDGHCEHFDVLFEANRVAADHAVIVFNVNMRPYLSKKQAPKNNYGMDDHDQWFAIRDAYYRRDSREFNVGFIKSFYEDWFVANCRRDCEVSAHVLRSTIDGHPDFFVRTIARIKTRVAS